MNSIIYKGFIIEKRGVFDKKTNEKILSCYSVKYAEKESKIIHEKFFISIPEAREFIDEELHNKKYFAVQVA